MRLCFDVRRAREPLVRSALLDGICRRSAALTRAKHGQVRLYFAAGVRLVAARAEQGVHLGRGQRGSCGDIDHEQVLPREIQRQVLMRLKETQLAHAFRADTRCGEVGDGAALKLDTHIGNVRLG